MNGASRERLIDAFLARCGWDGADRREIPGDASARRYVRLAGGRGRAVLMDAPPPEDVGPFVRVARHIAAAGLAPPRILGADEARGFLLLEDLGDGLFSRVLRRGGDEMVLYRAAVEALAVLHRHPVPGDLPAYDDELLLFEVSLLTDWFMPLAGLRLSAEGRGAFLALWRDLLPLARAVPDGIVLRDYHADNLVWLPEREGVLKVGQLDFQDAVVGPVTYDIVSLLEDVRRDVAPAVAAAAREHYLGAMPHLDRRAFAVSAAVLGVHRNLKIAGIFCRLLSRDGKADYQRYLPRTWRMVAAGLRHPALAPLAGWLDRWIPPAARTRAA